MKRNPILWVASKRSAHIVRRKVNATDRRLKSATFHESWAEAHAAVVARAEESLAKARIDMDYAQRWLKSAERALERVRRMTPPAEGASPEGVAL